MQPTDSGFRTKATMTSQRWCVRLLSILYYFVTGPLLFDLFAHGARGRSAYLFPFILMSVLGLQAAYKESDLWVRIWYWVNLPLISLITLLAFFSVPFGVIVSLYSWEKWVLFGMMLCSLLFFPLHFFLPRSRMTPVGSEPELEPDIDMPKPLPPAPTPVPQPAAPSVAPPAAPPVTPPVAPSVAPPAVPSVSPPATPPAPTTPPVETVPTAEVPPPPENTDHGFLAT